MKYVYLRDNLSYSEVLDLLEAKMVRNENERRANKAAMDKGKR